MDKDQIKQEFTRLIQENKGIIFKICNAYCPGEKDRDDLAQEIVYQLWKSFKGYNKDYKFSTWMYRVGLNVAISFYRTEKRRSDTIVYPENLMELQVTATNDSVETDQNISLLKHFISGLKEIDKSIIILYLEGRNYVEIAEILGMTETNVGTRINRVKDKLRKNFSTINK